MELILGIDRLKRPFHNPVIALGNFDGVHLGHQKIFERVKSEAVKIGGEEVVVTFEPHPLKVLSPPHCPPLLSSFHKKMRLIEQSGMGTVLCIEFTRDFSRQAPGEFVQNILIDRINPRKIIVGYNYHFGQKKSGDVQTLRKLCQPFQIGVEIVDPFLVDGTPVSSSRIRDLIRNGRMEEAAKLLGRDYPIIGKVIEGAKRGRTLGFPTANLELVDELYPPTGVYAVQVSWNHQVYPGLASLGRNPTFQPPQGDVQQTASLEVFILNFDQMIYGEEIQVQFKRRIREEVRFESSDQLIEQIHKDIRWAQENVFKNAVLAA